MISFLNDYNKLGSKEVLEALLNIKDEYNIGYGDDIHTLNARNIIKNLIENPSASVYFLAGGTLTNKIGLFHMLRPYESVICVESGHINVHETGAIESNGHKVLTVKGNNGKISSKEIIEVLKDHTDKHKVMPRVVYISNSTEIGTTYSLKELKEIYKTCKENGLYLFIDGARIGVALTSEDNDITLKDYALYSDMFYIGGTKNGAPIGEALIIVNKELQNGFEYLIKNQGGLLAKGYLYGVIFETLFTNDLFFNNAKNANLMAKSLRNIFKKHNIKEAYINNTNQIFVYLDDKLANYLKDYVLFESWNINEKSYRFVTNYSTNLDDINGIDTILTNFEKN